MLSPRRRRAMSGVAAATVATLVALVSHLLGGGDVPALLGVAAPWVLSLPVCIALAGRRLALWRLSLSVTLSQLLFHALFVLGTPADSATFAVTPHLGHAGHDGTGMVALPDASVHTAAMHADPAMWAWHGVAALVTITSLHHGEHALIQLRELARQTAAWVRRCFTDPRAWARPTLLAAIRALPGWSSTALSASAEVTPLRRRGPPSPIAL